ncbi:MAG: 2-phosphosulfolactate phosphatase [Gemmatimonadota bacterium]
MRIDVHFTPAELDSAALADATVVVVDVIRATTSMIEALAAGAKAIFPTASTEEAVRLATSLGRDDTLLCGERKGVKVEGFDLGNSPLEYVPDVVAGKRLVWSTTNGTGAIALVQEADRVVLGAFTNLCAVARAVAEDPHVIVLNAGRQRRFTWDDGLCAGYLVRELTRRGGDAALNDAARAALVWAQEIEIGVDTLQRTEAGQALEGLDLADDLEICAHVDRHDIVPELREKALVIRDGG